MRNVIGPSARTMAPLVALCAVFIAAACDPQQVGPQQAGTQQVGPQQVGPQQPEETTAAREAGSVPLAEAGAPALGRAYAQHSCATCHAVAAGQLASPNPTAPAFQTIADTPGMTRMALNVWLHTPHPTMPNLVVDPDRIEDLAAYISSLRTKREPN